MLVEKPILISTHIEKTAGTSLQSLFESAVGRKHVLVYDAATDRLQAGSQLNRRNVSPVLNKVKQMIMDTPIYTGANRFAVWVDSKRTKEELTEIPPDALIVHGHFLANRYDDVVTQPLRSIVFRNPLDRMRSQYDHWKRNRGHVIWRVNIPYDPTMAFEEYALLPKLQSYQTQAIAGKPLEDFDAIGITENLNLYTHALITLFNNQGWCDRKILEAVPIPRFTQTSERSRTTTDQLGSNFLQGFRTFHAEDYRLYDATRRFIDK